MRFANNTGGVLERGPIAVFEQGSFLGQGMVDPLPDGATATVPFALERALAVDQERKYDELGERVAKIENGELTIERDAVTQTKYRVRNGGDAAAKMLVRHPRIARRRASSSRRRTPRTTSARDARSSRRTSARARRASSSSTSARRCAAEDWFSVVADNAVKAYLADPRADKTSPRSSRPRGRAANEIVALREARQQARAGADDLAQQTEETRRNLRAIEKNKSADALRAKLTARLGEMATRLDDITKQLVEIDSKLAELRVRFKEAIRDIKLDGDARSETMKRLALVFFSCACGGATTPASVTVAAATPSATATHDDGAAETPDRSSAAVGSEGAGRDHGRRASTGVVSTSTSRATLQVVDEHGAVAAGAPSTQRIAVGPDVFDPVVVHQAHAAAAERARVRGLRVQRRRHAHERVLPRRAKATTPFTCIMHVTAPRSRRFDEWHSAAPIRIGTHHVERQLRLLERASERSVRGDQEPRDRSRS